MEEEEEEECNTCTTMEGPRPWAAWMGTIGKVRTDEVDSPDVMAVLSMYICVRPCVHVLIDIKCERFLLLSPLQVSFFSVLAPFILLVISRFQHFS